MQKKIIFCFSLSLLLVLSSGGFGVLAETAGAPAPDEAVIAGLLQKTSTTTMLFTGGNGNWDCCYKVVDTAAASGARTSTTDRMKFVLTPLLLESKYHTYTRYFDYAILTSRGKFSGEQWLTTGDVIQIEANCPIPVSNEVIKVKISEWFNEEEFYLTNMIPSNAISPEQAFRKAFTVYYATYGVYPTAKFTFEIEFYDKTCWLVTFDDNDGIGGKGYLLIDALTGEAGEIKEDE